MWNQFPVSGYAGQYFSAFCFCISSVLLGETVSEGFLWCLIVAGISFEIIQWAGRSDSKLADFFSKPGLAMQKLTTKEPTADMAEVAIKAVEAVFDWRAYLKEEFGWYDQKESVN